MPPVLRSGRLNSILVYPGSINPPHRGHLELLQYGFGRSGRDFNLIAAIILPLDDVSLARKLGSRAGTGHGYSIKREGSSFWKQDRGPRDWYWIYDRSLNEWGVFEDRLRKAVIQDKSTLNSSCYADQITSSSIAYLLRPYGVVKRSSLVTSAGLQVLLATP